MSTVTERVAARIVHFRHKRGMTQETLAAKARLHRITLITIERARKQPTLETLDRIARALGVTLADLVK
jgi:transcriptional regulator with XRE-family HTH domain